MTKPPRHLFIGRWQPFHRGHQTIIREALEIGPVAIGVRDTELDVDNPYTVTQRIRQIYAHFHDWEDVEVFAMPDIAAIHIGRGVGYEIITHDEVPGVSGTDLREAMVRCTQCKAVIATGRQVLFEDKPYHSDCAERSKKLQEKPNARRKNN